MSNATFYFGGPVPSSKSASAEAKALGIDLMRASPSEINPVVVVDYVQPGHSVYKDFLGAYIQSSIHGITISSRNPPYHPLQNKGVDSTMRLPNLIWNYSNNLNAEAIAQLKVDIGASETKTITNKGAFEMTITSDAFKRLQAHALKPNSHTPTGTTHINIAGFSTYLFLNRLFDAFCRANQYPGFKTNNRADIGWSKLYMMVDGTETTKEVTYKDVCVASCTMILIFKLQKVDGVTDTVAKIVDANYADANFLIFANTATRFQDFQYEYEVDSDFPTGLTYLFLPFEKVLTKTDYSVIPRVIQRYFMGTLAVSAEIAALNFLDVKSNWGNLCKTSWGDILAHKFRCIEMCLQAQGSLRLIKSNGVYKGCVIAGGMYTLTFNDTVYRPVSREEILVQIKNATPHKASLDYIFSKITYASATERANGLNACATLADVNFQIRSHGIIEAERSEIRRRAYHLQFPGDGMYLTPTAHNISRVFTAIGDASISAVYPLHPEAIDSNFREERLLSSFGAAVPSFYVPNGKKMSLEGNFFVRERNPGNNNLEDREVHKIACVTVPLKQAYADFLKMKDSKAILNPYGAQIGKSNANTAITRSFEKESASEIVVSLRKAVGASAVSRLIVGKRKAEDDIGPDPKRGAFDLDF